MKYNKKLLSIFFVMFFLQGCALDDAMHNIPIVSFIYGIPDWDINLSKWPIINWFVVHRSILTHNCIPPIIVALLCKPLKRAGVVISGCFGLIFAIHFFCDMFPDAWVGFSFVHIPILGRLQWIGNWFATIFSFCWFGAMAIISLCSPAITLSDE